MLFQAFGFFIWLLLFETGVAGPLPPRSSGGETLARREYFYVGGSYVTTGTQHLFADQMYVEKLSPEKSYQPYPIVFIHGQGQTGTVRQCNPTLEINLII